MRVGIVEEILAPWALESQTVDETEFTRWAEPGWQSWNGMAAEREFCKLAAALARMVSGDGLVVETGVGGGFTTRRVGAAVVASGGQMLCFESDLNIRKGLRDLDPPFFVPDGPVQLSEDVGPSADELGNAALAIFDSEVEWRTEEIRLWSEVARPGAMMLAHDTGNGHPPHSMWMKLRQQIEDLGIKGTLLKNPRGGFLGVR